MLEAKGLTVVLGNKTLINQLSFQLTSPAFVAVIGHNGAGKTSLLNAFMNLLPYRGEIFFNASPAILYQHNSIRFDIPAKDVAVMGLFAQKNRFQNYSKTDYHAVQSLFKKLNIEHLANQPFNSLSGGEKQLVWLAQLLIQQKELLLLDEPTQYLDVRNKKILFQLFNQLVQHDKKTIFCVTHDILNLYEMSGYILNLSLDQLYLDPISTASIDKHLAYLEK